MKKDWNGNVIGGSFRRVILKNTGYISGMSVIKEPGDNGIYISLSRTDTSYGPRKHSIPIHIHKDGMYLQFIWRSTLTPSVDTGLNGRLQIDGIDNYE